MSSAQDLQFTTLARYIHTRKRDRALPLLKSLEDANINRCDESGKTLLMIGLEVLETEIVEFLIVQRGAQLKLSRHADVFIFLLAMTYPTPNEDADQDFVTNRNDMQATPTHPIATRYALDVLIKESQQQGSGGEASSKILLDVIQTQRCEVVRFLLPQVRDRLPLITSQALHEFAIAVSGGHMEVVRYLFESVRPKETEKDTTSAFSLSQRAAMHGRLSAWKFLESKFSFAAMKVNDCVALAAQHGRLSMLKYLMEKYPTQMDIQDLFLSACAAGKVSIARYLVEEKGADPNATHSDWVCTAVRLAAQLKDPSLLRWLICEKKANPKGAILDAAATNRLENLKWLVREGVSKVTEVDKDNGSVLGQAAWKGNFEIVRWLIEEANVSEISKLEFSISVKSRSGNLDLIQYLFDRKIAQEKERLMLYSKSKGEGEGEEEADARRAKENFEKQEAEEWKVWFRDSVKSGFPAVIRWVLSKRPQKSVPAESLWLILAEHIIHPHILRDIFDSFSEKERNPIFTHCVLEKALKRCQFDLIRILIEEYRLPIVAISDDPKAAFATSCLLDFLEFEPSIHNLKALWYLFHYGCGIGCSTLLEVILPNELSYLSDSLAGSVLIGLKRLSRFNLFEKCIFSADQLRTSILGGSYYVNQDGLYDRVKSILSSDNWSKSLLDSETIAELEKIRSQRLDRLLSSKTLLRTCVNFLNCTDAGQEALRRYDSQRSAFVVLPHDVEKVLLFPPIVDENKEKKIRRVNENVKISSDFWTIAAILCLECSWIDFPGCGTHDFLLTKRLYNMEAICAHEKCKVCTENKWQKCRGCKTKTSTWAIQFFRVTFDEFEQLRVACDIYKQSPSKAEDSDEEEEEAEEDDDLASANILMLYCPLCDVIEFPRTKNAATKNMELVRWQRKHQYTQGSGEVFRTGDYEIRHADPSCPVGRCVLPIEVRLPFSEVQFVLENLPLTPKMNEVI